MHCNRSWRAEGKISREGYMLFLVQCWQRTDDNKMDYIKKQPCIQQCRDYSTQIIPMYIYQTLLTTQEALLSDCPNKMFNHGNKSRHDCTINNATNSFQQHLFWQIRLTSILYLGENIIHVIYNQCTLKKPVTAESHPTITVWWCHHWYWGFSIRNLVSLEG
jgi:hypothetical protein